MIYQLKDIVTEDPNKQIWKFLNSFHDNEFVSKQICRLHGIKEENSKKYKKDIFKQAQQISNSIRQAKEYFSASTSVQLPTRPVLLYYGAVSLSYALILLRGDGKFSFDMLRKIQKHRHHGLELRKDFETIFNQTLSAEKLFESLNIEIFTNKNTGEPWGNFRNFYNFLVPCSCEFTATIHEVGKEKNHKFTRKNPQATGNLQPLSNFCKKPFNILALLKSLPDMYYHLTELGIIPDLCRGEVHVDVFNHYEKTSAGATILKKYNVNNVFTLNGIQVDQREALLNFLNSVNSGVKIFSSLAWHLVLKVDHNYELNESSGEYILLNKEEAYLPDVGEDIHGNKFYFIKPENYMPEAATHLVILYGFSMLARYFPDLWMKAIDENVRFAEITDSFLNLTSRKFPNLILDQLTWIKHNVHL